MDGELFFLGGLAHVVFKGDLDHGVNDGLIAVVGDLAVEITDGCAGEVLRCAGFEIGKLQIGGVGRGFGGLFLIGTEGEEEGADNYRNDDDSDEDGAEAGVAGIGGGWLEQAGHGAIVQLRSFVVSRRSSGEAERGRFRIPAIGKVERGGMDLLMDSDLFSFYLLKIFLAKGTTGLKTGENAAIALLICKELRRSCGRKSEGHGLSSIWVVSGVAVGYN